jgi:excinuclease UvrABC nuclease subunit
MPFAEFAPRSFTAASIRKNAPDASGVYGLSNAREWLFVGECNNIRLHLLEHLNETGTVLKAQHPTGFKFELCSPEERIARQDRLVLELEPRCNRRYPNQD